MLRKHEIFSEKLRIARTVVAGLRRALRKSMMAAGIYGSVARGTAEKYSDIDLIVIVRKPCTDSFRFRIVNATFCSIVYETLKGALSQLSTPTSEFPELLGGFRKILPLYDPLALLPKLEARARSIPEELFRKSAKIALLESYEDFCRAKNAFLNHDDIVLKDNVDLVTQSAALVVASLNQSAFTSDREIFKAHKGFSKLPRRFDRIERLRYGNLKRAALFRMLMGFYLDTVDFCRREGIRFPVDERTLKELDP